MQKGSNIPELNANCKQLSFVQGDHPKLFFRDEIQKTLKDISVSDRISSDFFRKPTVSFHCPKRSRQTSIGKNFM